jgi:hypothetical protein
MGFTKLDDQLGDSSLMSVPGDTFKAFIYILSKTGPDGIARTSVSGIAGNCRLSIEAARRAVKGLSSPDPDSRSKAGGGRRIKRVDGGFLVVNYLRYRERSYSNEPAAILKRAYRERKKAEQEKESGKENTLPLREAEAEMSGTCPDNVLNGKGIYFVDGEWTGLDESTVEGLRLRFPCVEAFDELGKMARWIMEDPSRNDPGKDRTEFIERWLKRPSWSGRQKA